MAAASRVPLAIGRTWQGQPPPLWSGPPLPLAGPMQTDTAPFSSTGLLTAFRVLAGLPPLEMGTVALAEVPDGLRGVLGQDGGMTAALERFWGEPMGLAVRRTDLRDGRLRREVVLAGIRRGLPSEAGFIDIRLDALPPSVAEQVIAGRQPFGAVLAAAGIRFRSRPFRFFQVAADRDLAEALQVPPGSILYGRETRLTDSGGRVLAEAVEILSGPAI